MRSPGVHPPAEALFGGPPGVRSTSGWSRKVGRKKGLYRVLYGPFKGLYREYRDFSGNFFKTIENFHVNFDDFLGSGRFLALKFRFYEKFHRQNRLEMSGRRQEPPKTVIFRFRSPKKGYIGPWWFWWSPGWVLVLVVLVVVLVVLGLNPEWLTPEWVLVLVLVVLVVVLVVLAVVS